MWNLSRGGQVHAQLAALVDGSAQLLEALPRPWWWQEAAMTKPCCLGCSILFSKWDHMDMLYVIKYDKMKSGNLDVREADSASNPGL